MLYDKTPLQLLATVFLLRSEADAVNIYLSLLILIQFILYFNSL